jgi:hypothetical protein
MEEKAMEEKIRTAVKEKLESRITTSCSANESRRNI